MGCNGCRVYGQDRRRPAGGGNGARESRVSSGRAGGEGTLTVNQPRETVIFLGQKKKMLSPEHLLPHRGHISKGRASARKEGPTTAAPALGLAFLQRTLSQGLGGQGEGLGVGVGCMGRRGGREPARNSPFRKQCLEASPAQSLRLNLMPHPHIQRPSRRPSTMQPVCGPLEQAAVPGSRRGRDGRG